MSAQKIRFGWSIECAEPECIACLEQWSEGNDTGPPCQDFQEAQNTGWLMHPARRYYTEGYWVGEFSGYGYHCYCPEHSAPGKQWEKDLAQWKDTRWNVGKTTHTELSVRAKIKNWCAQITGRKVGQTVKEWETKNPRPLAPWEVTDENVS